jgi:transmembrane sensor
MDNHPKLTPAIVEEASYWFVEFSEGTIDAAARAQFDAWLRRSPEHVQAYLKISMLWEETPLMGKTRVLASDELLARVLAEDNIVTLGKPQLGSEPSSPNARVSKDLRATSRPGSRRAVFAVAASLLVVITLGTWVFTQRGTYSTAIGEQRSVRLEDGSTVDLNSQSKVRVRFGDHQRSIELLEGQALFRVAKDTSRPFIVATDNTHVRAIGTQFDVYRKRGSTVVTVIEGRVAVLSPATAALSTGAHSAELANSETQKPLVSARANSSGPSGAASPADAARIPVPLMPQQGEILLAAGEQVTVAPQSVSPPREADLALATAWTQRKIAFKAAPLGEVVEEFNRYNARQLVIMDEGIRTTKISGVFSSTDPDSLLRFLHALPNISVEETGSEIRIERK